MERCEGILMVDRYEGKLKLHLLIYFDSWEDLKNKINTLNYEEHKLKLKNFGETHIQTTLEKWKYLINNTITIL